jgi:hypothetical protein
MAKTERHDPKPLWEQEAGWCVHFNGMMNQTCRLGIAYDTVRGQERGQFPCLKQTYTDPTRTDLCSSAEYLTVDQAKVKADEKMARIRAKLERMVEGYCIQCDQKIERQVKVGRCLYAEPCGHRLGQGR